MVRKGEKGGERVELDRGRYTRKCLFQFINSHAYIYAIILFYRSETVSRMTRVANQQFFKTMFFCFSLLNFFSLMPLPPHVFISSNGISVKTDLIANRAVSRLYIANANRLDSGNYTCAIGDFARVTVAVHVLNGKFLPLIIFFCNPVRIYSDVCNFFFHLCWLYRFSC